MKYHFIIDDLTQRDGLAYMLELLLSLDENATISTMMYDEKVFLGRLKTRKIVASPFQNKFFTRQEWQENFWLIPSMIRELYLEKNTTPVILSFGVAHALIPKSLRAKSKLYIFDWLPIKKKWSNFWLAPYFETWRKSALADYKEVRLAHQKLEQYIKAPVLNPTYSTADFFVDESESIPQKHLVHTIDLTQEEVNFFENFKEKVWYFGPINTNLSLPGERYLGDHCNGTLQSYHMQSKVIWDLSKQSLPIKALQAQLSGRLTVVSENADQSLLYQEGNMVFPSSLSLDEKKVFFSKVDELAFSVDRKKMRRFALRWNERFFKNQFSDFINSH